MTLDEEPCRPDQQRDGQNRGDRRWRGDTPGDRSEVQWRRAFVHDSRFLLKKKIQRSALCRAHIRTGSGPRWSDVKFMKKLYKNEVRIWAWQRNPYPERDL